MTTTTSPVLGEPDVVSVDTTATSAALDGPESERLAALSAGTRQFLEVAAVLGAAFSLDEVAAVLSDTPAAVLPYVDEALHAELIECVQGTCRFRGPQVHAAFYGRTPAPLRLALHRQVGTALLEQGGAAAAAATHLTRGARLANRDDLCALDRAAELLCETAPRQAANVALRALELTGQDARATRAARAVEMLVAADRAPEARVLADETLASPGADSASGSRLRAARAALRLAAGEPTAALADAEAVLAQPGAPAEAGDAAGTTRIASLLARGDMPAVERVASNVLGGRHEPCGERTLAAALTALGRVSWDRGEVRAALSLVAAAAERADRAPTAWQEPRFTLAWMCTALGELDTAAHTLDTAEARLRVTSDSLGRPLPALLRARLALAGGDLSAAAWHAQRAEVLADELGNGLLLLPALTLLAQIALLTGSVATATSMLSRRDAAAPADAPWDPGQTWVAAQVAEAGVGPVAAYDEMAAALVAELAERPRLLVSEPLAAPWLTRLALAAGHPEGADAVVRTAQRLAVANPGLLSLQVSARHSRGLLERDASALRSAADGHRQAWPAAVAAHDAGVVLSGTGDRSDAEALLDRALSAFSAMQADRMAAEARLGLRNLGVRRGHGTRASRPVSGWESLTDAEVRVARAVSEGLTTSEAARRLFLSPHTVNSHVRHAFRKLAIRSRVELTRIVLAHPEEGV
jgi:DNA-binding CsgD family transcriptional regulator